jgi:hypothetical protein
MVGVRSSRTRRARSGSAIATTSSAQGRIRASKYSLSLPAETVTTVGDRYGRHSLCLKTLAAEHDIQMVEDITLIREGIW